MKKIILTVAAVCAFGFASAQESKFGIKGGMNLANFSGDVEDNSTKVGFNVGGFVEIKISEKFSVQPELLFSTQGAQSKYTEDTIKFKEELNLSYINIPVMAKFYVADKFSLEAGPQIGFLVSAKAKAEVTDGINSSSEEGDVKDGFKSTDFGFNLGTGYDFTDNLSAGVRYNLGLSNILKDSGSTKLQNTVFSVSVAYKF